VRILVLGSGAREHAVAWKLAQSRRVRAVFAGPGNAGTSQVATNLPAVDPLDFGSVTAACRAHRIDLVFVGPETPLASGVVDALDAEKIAAIGPHRTAAQLEGSKSFSKAFLVRNALPTAHAEEISDLSALEHRLRGWKGGRLVIKKSGLAAGKGVLESSDPAELLRFGRGILAADRLLVEEFLDGWEVSIFGMSDGRSHIVLPPCTDFKKAGDGDTGPNTGGMGAICPVPWVDAALRDRISRDVVEPTYAALQREGLDYAGILYFGLMITAAGPKILEFNVRFGDPETQVLMPMLQGDLGEMFQAMSAGSLVSLAAASASDAASPVQGPGAALGVVVAAPGYPEKSEKGAVVDPLSPNGGAESGLVFHASTSLDSTGRVLTGGGRCFTAVGTGAALAEAGGLAYQTAARVRFDGAWYRRDIGRRFMEARQ
jgi:phosphoribosylamine---glycine ligase